ncbi:hypothetical protein ACK3TF_001218 [Chlorella vulgaris]
MPSICATLRPQNLAAARTGSTARRPRLPAVRAQASPSAVKPEVDSAVSTLKKAAADGTVPPSAVYSALVQLEQAKLPASDDWNSTIGGNASPGNRWRLVFTTGTKKGSKAEGKGNYFPITACQRWDATTSEIENGVFLGRFAALTFKGPYAMDGKILAFDFDTLKLRLGGWTPSFGLKAKIEPSTFKRTKDAPFFAFFYVDDSIICARGRGGGIAVWARTTPAWELEKGVV